MKPVAWIDYLEHSDVYDLNVSGRGVPLYTHPVKEPMMVLDGNRVYPAFKELTDKEILQQALFSFGNESENFDDSYWIGFARAILRKAQDK